MGIGHVWLLHQQLLGAEHLAVRLDAVQIDSGVKTGDVNLPFARLADGNAIDFSSRQVLDDEVGVGCRGDIVDGHHTHGGIRVGVQAFHHGDTRNVGELFV